MNIDDKKFYAAWGILFILIGVSIIVYFLGYGALVPFIIFGGMGFVLILFSDLKGISFYTGVFSMTFGALLTSVLLGTGPVIAVAVIVIIIGVSIFLHIFLSGGDEK